MKHRNLWFDASVVSRRPSGDNYVMVNSTVRVEIRPLRTTIGAVITSKRFLSSVDAQVVVDIEFPVGPIGQ